MFERINILLFGLDWPLPAVLIAALMLLIALLSLKTGHLTISGAGTAVLLGFSVTWGLRLEGLVLLLVFFVFSNIAGRLSRKHTGKCSPDIRKKGGARDWMQVLANGLMAGVGALWWALLANPAALVVFGTSVAEAFSDTLAGELGCMSAKQPVSIATFRPVKRGMSGGITVVGTFAGFCASAIIAILWVLFFMADNCNLNAVFICLAGFAGCIVDSLLGALVQAVYSDSNGLYTEKSHDMEGHPNALVRGIPFMDNDMVNFISNIFSVMFALGLYLIFE